MELFWLAQAVGAIGLVFSVLSYNSKTRNGILAHQSGSSVVYFVHYLMLQGWTGAVMNVIVILRNWIFIKKETREWAKNEGWMYFFIVLSVASLPFTWEGYISLLPALAAVIGVYSRWHHPPSQIRFYSLVGSVLWLPYNIVVHSVAGTVATLIIIVAIVLAMIKHDRPTPAEKELGGL